MTGDHPKNCRCRGPRRQVRLGKRGARWSVSFRPNPDGSRMRHYANPHVVARVILSNPRQHDEAAALDPLPDERDVTAELLACTGMEPAPGSPVLLHLP